MADDLTTTQIQCSPKAKRLREIIDARKDIPKNATRGDWDWTDAAIAKHLNGEITAEIAPRDVLLELSVEALRAMNDAKVIQRIEAAAEADTINGMVRALKFGTKLGCIPGKECQALLRRLGHDPNNSSEAKALLGRKVKRMDVRDARDVIGQERVAAAGLRT